MNRERVDRTDARAVSTDGVGRVSINGPCPRVSCNSVCGLGPRIAKYPLKE